MLFKNIFDDVYELRDIFNDVLGVKRDRTQKHCFPYCNVKDTKESITIATPLPGIDAKDLDIEYNDGYLYIKGSRKSERQEGAKYLREERFVGDFEKSLKIDVPIDHGKVNAKYKDGILYIELNKAPEATPITIKLSNN